MACVHGVVASETLFSNVTTHKGYSCVKNYAVHSTITCPNLVNYVVDEYSNNLTDEFNNFIVS